MIPTLFLFAIIALLCAPALMVAADALSDPTRRRSEARRIERAVERRLRR